MATLLKVFNVTAAEIGIGPSYGTMMRRPHDAEDDGFQHGMALGGNAGVLILSVGLPSFTSDWEIDPEADA